jgi:hypothetical protein
VGKYLPDGEGVAQKKAMKTSMKPATPECCLTSQVDKAELFNDSF